jgi:hypothetical protein
MTKPDGILWAVLDADILVSALLSAGPAAFIVDRVAGERIRPCLTDSGELKGRPKKSFPRNQHNSREAPIF